MYPLNVVISLHTDEDTKPIMAVTCDNALKYQELNKHLTNVNMEYVINGINKYYSITFVPIKDTDYVINNVKPII